MRNHEKIERMILQTQHLKSGGSGENALDKDSFSKMSYSERLHLKDTQPEVYENLIKQMIK